MLLHWSFCSFFDSGFRGSADHEKSDRAPTNQSARFPDTKMTKNYCIFSVPVFIIQYYIFSAMLGKVDNVESNITEKISKIDSFNGKVN